MQSCESLSSSIKSINDIILNKNNKVTTFHILWWQKHFLGVGDFQQIVCWRKKVTVLIPIGGSPKIRLHRKEKNRKESLLYPCKLKVPVQQWPFWTDIYNPLDWFNYHKTKRPFMWIDIPVAQILSRFSINRESVSPLEIDTSIHAFLYTLPEINIATGILTRTFCC